MLFMFVKKYIIMIHTFNVLVSKLSIGTSDKHKQNPNIPDIFSTFSVLKFIIFKNVIVRQYWNIKDISKISLVSNFERFKISNELYNNETYMAYFELYLY